MLIMIRVFEKLDQLKIEHASNVILGMIGIMASLFLLSLFVGRISAGAGLGILSIVAAVWLAVIGIQRLQDLNIDLSEKGPAILLVGGLVLFLAWVQKFTGAVQVIKKGERIKKAQTGFISIIFGLVACVGAVYVLAQLSNKQLFNGVTATISLLGVLFGGLYILVGQISKLQAGIKTSGTFIGLSILTLVVSALFAIVTIAMHFGAAEAWQAVGVIAVLFTFLSGVLASAHKMTDTGKSLFGLMGVVIALGAVVAAFWLMARADFKTLVASVGMLSALMIAAAFAVKIIAKIRMSDLVDAKQTIGFMVGVLAVLVSAVVALSYFVENTDGLIKSAGALAIIAGAIIAVFAVVALIGNLGGGASKAAIEGGKAFAIVIGVIVAIALLLYSLVLILTDNMKNIGLLKQDLNEVVEVAYLLGAVVSSLLAGLFIGGARLVADELSEVAKRLIPFAKAIEQFPSDFATKAALFGKGILALSWYGFWTGLLGGIGEKGSLKRLANSLKESAGPIRDASIAFMNVNIAGLKKAVEALTAMSDLASSMTIFSALFMNFKMGLMSSAIKTFTKTLEPITQDHVTKAGYLVEIFTKFANMPTRERANIFSDQKSLLSMSISLWSTTLFLNGIIKRLGDIETSDLYNAQTNTKNLVSLFTSISAFTAKLDKNMGATQLWSGSRETTLFEYMLLFSLLGSWVAQVDVKNMANNYNKDDLDKAKENLTSIIGVFEVLHNFASTLDAGGGLVQAISGSATAEFNAYTKLINQLPGVADAVILYGKKFLEPTNVQAVMAAQNVTNSLGDAFHNLADQDLTARLQAVAQAIRELGNSGIENIPDFFSDELTTVAINQAVENLVAQFHDVLFVEFQKNRIGGYVGGLMHGALMTLKTFDQQFYERGQHIADALVNGVASRFGNVKSSGTMLAKQVAKGVESPDGFDIQSPSQKMFTDGVLATEGLRLGMLSQFDKVEETGEAIGKAGGGGIGVGLANSLRGINFTAAFNKSLGTDKLVKQNGIFGIKLIKEDTGEETGVVDAIKDAWNPFSELQNLPDEIGNMLGDSPWLQGMLGDFSSTVDELKGLFSPKGVQASAESIEKSMQITEGVLSQLAGIPENYHEVLEASSETYTIWEDLLSEIFGGNSPESFVDNMTSEITTAYESAMSDLTGMMAGDWNMGAYTDSLMNELDSISNFGYDLPITPVLTDENGNEITDWQSMLGGSSGSLGRTVAGYTSEDVRNLTAEIYHLEDALYSLKEAMKDQQVTHSGELTIRYSNESDFVDRIQTAIIGEIRREVRG